MNLIKNSRKGFMYTVFALFILNLVFLGLIAPFGHSSFDDGLLVEQVEGLTSFTRSVEDDMVRGVESAGSRTVLAVYQDVLNGSYSSETFEENFEEVFYNGTLEGEERSVMEDSTFSDWESSIRDESDGTGYIFDYSFESLEVVDKGFDMVFGTSYSMEVGIRGEDTGYTFSNVSKDVFVGSEGLEDPLTALETDGRVSKIIDRCDEERFIGEKFEGSTFRYNDSETNDGGSFVSGFPVEYGSSNSFERKESVIFVEDICGSDLEYLQGYAGVVSKDEEDPENVCNSGSSFDAYVGGVEFSDLEFRQGSVTVLSEESVYETFLLEKVRDGCFFESSIAPGFLERMGKPEKQGSKGFGYFVDVRQLPADFSYRERSAVGHKYFTDEVGSLERIKGVSDMDGFSWFLLDKEYVEYLGVEELVY